MSIPPYEHRLSEREAFIRVRRSGVSLEDLMRQQAEEETRRLIIPKAQDLFAAMRAAAFELHTELDPHIEASFAHSLEAITNLRELYEVLQTDLVALEHDHSCKAEHLETKKQHLARIEIAIEAGQKALNQRKKELPGNRPHHRGLDAASERASRAGSYYAQHQRGGR